MKKEKENNKSLNKQKKIIIIILLAVIILGLLLIEILKLTSKSQPKGLTFDDFYSENNCRCVEREMNKCTNGYELEGDFCVNKTLGTFTNVIKGCSKYECLGMIYEFNLNLTKWEKK